MPTSLPPAGTFFGSLITANNTSELAKLRARLQEILAQPDEHDPRRVRGRLLQAHAAHAAQPTQESYSAVSELSKGAGTYSPEEVMKWADMVTAAKRQAWSCFKTEVAPKLLSILTSAKEACERESTAQAKREAKWAEEMSPYTAWAAYYGRPFATATDAPAFLGHCAELLAEDIRRLQGCQLQGTVFPREFTEFLQSGSVNVMGSLGVFAESGPKTVRDVAPRVARGFR